MADMATSPGGPELPAEETRALFSAVLLASHDGIVCANEQGRITFANPSMEALLGWRPTELVGRPLTVLMPPRFHAAHLAGLRRYTQTGQGRVIGTAVELVAMRRDGEEVPIELSLGTATVGGVRLFTGILRDIRERKESETALAEHASQLEMSNQDLQDFAFAISHDLQEPLRTVSGHAKLLMQRHGESLEAEGRDLLEQVVSGADQMRERIVALLQLARVGGEASAEPSADAAEAAHAAIAGLRRAIDEAGATIDVGRLPGVRCDPAELALVFQNLISNGLKFRGEAATAIRIMAREDDATAHMTVEDNGIGVAPQYHERIFGVFRRLHPQDGPPGTGMGLAICRRIVRKHGGRIWVESDEGRGATFHIALPLAGPVQPSGSS